MNYTCALGMIKVLLSITSECNLFIGIVQLYGRLKTYKSIVKSVMTFPHYIDLVQMPTHIYFFCCKYCTT